MLWLLPIGLLAGILTTVTGVGGGMVALSLLSLVMDPAAALAISAAAFAFGNTHRAVMFARSVDRRVTARFGLGLAAGAVGGALLVPHVPGAVLRVALVGVAVMALAKALGAHLRHRLGGDAGGVGVGGAGGGMRWPAAQLVSAGVVVGAIGAGAGGAGVLVSPILLGNGLRRDAYVATVASCAIVLNGSRVIGYALGGLYHPPMLLSIVALSAALVLGNLAGGRLREHLSGPLLDRIELGTPLVAIALALLGA
jgi:uncharacterized membrane protein YfcA